MIVLMRRLMNHRFTKLFAIFIALVGFLLPTCGFTCRSMAMEKVTTHECCHEKEISSAKLTQPPCCEWCRTLKAPAALTSAPLTSQDLHSVVQMILPSDPGLFKRSVDVNPENHAQSPPLYLSFKTLLC